MSMLRWDGIVPVDPRDVEVYAALLAVIEHARTPKVIMDHRPRDEQDQAARPVIERMVERLGQTKGRWTSDA